MDGILNETAASVSKIEGAVNETAASVEGAVSEAAEVASDLWSKWLSWWDTMGYPWLADTWAAGSESATWARPATFTFIGVVLGVSALHFFCQHRRRSRDWRDDGGATAVRVAGAPSCSCLGPDVLLLYRFGVLVYSAWTLASSSLAAGPDCLRFFTVWNFAALVVFFALGTGLSCAAAVGTGEVLGKPPSAGHRLAAAAHHRLLEVELPMAAMVAVVVWLIIYPYEEHAQASLESYTSLTSLTMHGANLAFMLVEFGLDALLVTPGHVGLVLAWGMLYGLFNGLQAYWTRDSVYFFTDFTKKKTPFVAVALTLLMGAIFGGACVLSCLKGRLLRSGAKRSHGADAELDPLRLGDPPDSTPPNPYSTPNGGSCERDGFDHSAVPYTLYTPASGAA